MATVDDARRERGKADDCLLYTSLLLIDINGMKEITTRVDRKVLTVALKGTSEQLRVHFLQCLSARGAEMLKEDMDVMGPVKIKDCLLYTSSPRRQTGSCWSLSSKWTRSPARRSY